MKNRLINIVKKSIKGQYLLLYLAIYTFTFGISNFFAEKKYMGTFYLDPGLAVVSPGILNDMPYFLPDKKRIMKMNDRILSLGDIEIPKKYKKNSQITLLYINGKTKNEVLKTSERVLDFVEQYKFNHFSNHVAKERIELKPQKKIEKVYKREERVLALIEPYVSALESMKKAVNKKLIRDCRKRETFILENCYLYVFSEISSALKKNRNVLNEVIEQHKMLNVLNLAFDNNSIEFASAKYIGETKIKLKPSNRKSIYELAFLFSTLGIVLSLFIKFLIRIKSSHLKNGK